LNGDEGNHTLDQPEVPGAETSIGGSERLTLEKNEDNDEADDDEVYIYIYRFENVLPLDFFIFRSHLIKLHKYFLIKWCSKTK